MKITHLPKLLGNRSLEYLKTISTLFQANRSTATSQQLAIHRSVERDHVSPLWRSRHCVTREAPLEIIVDRGVLEGVVSPDV